MITRHCNAMQHSGKSLNLLLTAVFIVLEKVQRLTESRKKHNRQMVD